MLKRILSLLLCTVIILSLVGCNNQNPNEYNEKNKIKIVTTNHILADFAKQIGGNNVEIEILLNASENSNTHVATNKDINKINECDILIYNGPEAEPWVYNVINELNNGNILVINAADGINVKNERYNINKADDTYKKEG